LSDKKELLRMENITKRFGDFAANDQVNLTVRCGEVHALLGENGAGKSTLMNILSGVYRMDEGTIYLHGKPVNITNPIEAYNHKIGMVFQHFMLVQAMTVTENIMLSTNAAGFRLPVAKTKKLIQEFSERYDLGIDPNKRVSDMSVGEQQRVEILKVLCANSELLILDEPTAVLTPDETQRLFDVIRRLVNEENHTVIFITHKLKEVMEICDRITILRRGKNVAVVDKVNTTAEELGSYMVGRRVSQDRFSEAKVGGETALSLKNLRYFDDSGVKRLDIDELELKSGEILGIAGVDGNGQSELAKAISGIIAPKEGSIKIFGKEMHGKTQDFINEGVAHIPEDRNKLGLVGEMGIHENLVLKCIDSTEYSKAHGLRIDHKKVAEHAAQMVEKYDIRAASCMQPVASLSGGNQQKVVLAREMESIPKILIAMHPTRGVDIGASEYIHKQLIAARDRGCAILLVSADLDEILRLSDRMAVLYEGRIMGYEDPENPDINRVSLRMAGKEAD